MGRRTNGKEPHLDTSKTWEERYNALVARLSQDARNVISHAPIRPAMWIGKFQNNDDAHHLVQMIENEMRMLIMLTGRNDRDFLLKWGRSPQGYHRNIDSRKTHLENLDTIKRMADDFLSWLDNKEWKMDINTVQKLYVEEFMEEPMNGVGISRLDLVESEHPAGQPEGFATDAACLCVYFEKNPKRWKDFPTVYEGFPVVYSVIGEIRAL